MRVALHAHHLGDVHGADLRDLAEVVPSEIHEHHVLGAVLFALQEFPGQRVVLGARGAAVTRSGNGAERHAPSRAPNEDLRRGAGHRAIGKAEIEHVGRRIEHPERAIDVERRDRGRRFEPVRQDDLHDVARPNVLLRPLDGGAEVLLADIAREDDLAVRGGRRGRRGHRLREARQHLVDGGDGVPIGTVRVSLGARVHDEA